MKITRLCTLLLLFVVNSFCQAQQNSSWVQWQWLIGDWTGVGSGEPGKGNGSFSFSLGLNDHILTRKAHSEYPASEGKPKVIHDDIMIIYPDDEGSPTRAIYFDNEGHTINYSVSFGEKSIILTSGKAPNVPVFRLSYIQTGEKAISVKFEMSQDGEKFMTYLEGTCVRV